MTEQLKPCPCCGATELDHAYEYGNPQMSDYIMCNGEGGCGLMISAIDAPGGDIVSAWNRRADAPAGQQEPATAQDERALPRLIEAKREAFESQFGRDIWPVYEWLRNEGVIARLAQPTPDTAALVEALEEIKHARMNSPLRENNGGCLRRIEQIAMNALAAYRTQQEVKP